MPRAISAFRAASGMSARLTPQAPLAESDIGNGLYEPEGDQEAVEEKIRNDSLDDSSPRSRQALADDDEREGGDDGYGGEEQVYACGQVEPIEAAQGNLRHQRIGKRDAFPYLIRGDGALAESEHQNEEEEDAAPNSEQSEGQHEHPERAVATVTQHRAVVLQDVAQEAGRPARALSDELTDCTRSIRVHPRPRRVLYSVAGLPHPERPLHVLGLMALAEAAEPHDHLSAIEGEGPRRHVDAVEGGERVPQCDAEDILRVLHMLEHVARAVDRHRGCGGRNALVGKAGNDLGERVALREGVGVEAADDLGRSRRDAGVERRMLVAVLLVDDPHLAVSRQAR